MFVVQRREQIAAPSAYARQLASGPHSVFPRQRLYAVVLGHAMPPIELQSELGGR